jgi:uncharacterized damage-inducible protein DinB
VDLKDFFLKQKQGTHRGMLEVLAKIPPEQLRWRPAEGMLSLGELVRHIWMSEEALRRAALKEEWDYFDTRVPQGLFAVLGEVKSLPEEIAQVERSHQATLREVAEFPLQRWEEERAYAKFNIRRRVCVILFGITEHQIHHRAQVGTYLRVLTGQRASPYPL